MNKLLLIMLSSSLLMMSCSPTNKKSSAVQQRTADSSKPTAHQLEAGEQVMAIDDIAQNMSPEQIEAQLIELRKEFNKLDNNLASSFADRNMLQQRIKQAEPAEKKNLQKREQALLRKNDQLMAKITEVRSKINSLENQLTSTQE